MNQQKALPKKDYQSRDEIEQDFFKLVKMEESRRGKTEKSKPIDEETLRQIQQLFSTK